MKVFKKNHSFILVVLLFFLVISCEDEFPTYPTINYIPCEETTVDIDQNIISDFECQTNFNLPGVEVVRNPAETQLNTSKFVGEFSDLPGAHDSLVVDYDAAIDLSSHTVFKIKIKTEVSGDLRVKLAGGTSAPVEITKEVVGNNGWATYTYDFSWRQGENHTRVELFFNDGIEVIGDNLYYIDDIMFDDYEDPCQNVVEDLSVLNDFECQQNYTLLDDSSPVERVNNPDISVSNSSIFVGKYIDDGTNPTDALEVNFEEPLDISSTPQLNIKIHSEKAVPLLARLQSENSFTEIQVDITETGEWINYVFDFSNASDEINKLLIYFNYGQTNGTTSDIYYVDDVKFLEAPCDQALIEDCVGVVQDLNIISDFNCQQNYGIEDVIPVVPNPLISCGNRSADVGEYTDNGNEPFDAFILDYGTTIDLTTHSQLKFKLYSPTSIQILAKLEGGTAIEIWSDFSATNEWQEFSYDFSGAVSNGNTKLVLFFNAGQTNGTSEDIYYIDELRWAEQ